MLLNELFKNAPEIDIKQLSYDSRMPMVDSIFFCLRGVQYDGHNFIDEAINNGAKVIVYDKEIDTKQKAIYIKVNNVKEALRQVSNKFYNYPSKDIETYLVCGCYDKDVVSYVLKYCLNYFKNVGYIGVNGITYNDVELANNFETLPLLENQRYLSDMRDNGIKACIFETSSLSLQYNKLDCIDFNTFIYTRTGKNSKDYIEGGSNYYDCIRKYLYSLENTHIILNYDDDSYDELCQTSDNVIAYGTSNNAFYQISSININAKGSTFSLSTGYGNIVIKTQLLGIQNIYNVTAAIIALIENNYDINSIIKAIEETPRLIGQYELINNNNYKIYIDDAKSLDEYEDIFKFAYQITDNDHKIYAVLSINDSDDEFRINNLIEIAEKYVDHIIFAPDELGENISDRLDYAYDNVKQIKAISVEDREFAIEQAFNLLNNDDTLLILGKGKENIIYNNDDKIHYDTDKMIIERLIKEKEKNDYEEI